MYRRSFPLRGSHRLHKEVAFQICTVFILPVQTGLGVLRQEDLRRHLYRRAGRKYHPPGFQGVQKTIGIVSGDLSIPVQVCLSVYLVQESGHIVQNDLGVSGVGVSVAIQVTVILGCGNKGRPVDQVANLRRQGRRLGVQVGNSILGKHMLGKEVRGQGIAPGLLGQVVEGKGNPVASQSLRVVTQFRLDLSIGSGGCGAGVHLNVEV